MHMQYVKLRWMHKVVKFSGVRSVFKTWLFGDLSRTKRPCFMLIEYRLSRIHVMYLSTPMHMYICAVFTVHVKALKIIIIGQMWRIYETRCIYNYSGTIWLSTRCRPTNTPVRWTRKRCDERWTTISNGYAVCPNADGWSCLSVSDFPVNFWRKTQTYVRLNCPQGSCCPAART